VGWAFVEAKNGHVHHLLHFAIDFPIEMDAFVQGLKVKLQEMKGVRSKKELACKALC
jgi:hypothetical protein